MRFVKLNLFMFLISNFIIASQVSEPWDLLPADAKIIVYVDTTIGIIDQVNDELKKLNNVDLKYFNAEVLDKFEGGKNTDISAPLSDLVKFDYTVSVIVSDFLQDVSGNENIVDVKKSAKDFLKKINKMEKSSKFIVLLKVPVPGNASDGKLSMCMSSSANEVVASIKDKCPNVWTKDVPNLSLLSSFRDAIWGYVKGHAFKCAYLHKSTITMSTSFNVMSSQFSNWRIKDVRFEVDEYNFLSLGGSRVFSFAMPSKCIGGNFLSFNVLNENLDGIPLSKVDFEIDNATKMVNPNNSKENFVLVESSNMNITWPYHVRIFTQDGSRSGNYILPNGEKLASKKLTSKEEPVKFAILKDNQVGNVLLLEGIQDNVVADVLKTHARPFSWIVTALIALFVVKKDKLEYATNLYSVLVLGLLNVVEYIHYHYVVWNSQFKIQSSTLSTSLLLSVSLLLGFYVLVINPRVRMKFVAEEVTVIHQSIMSDAKHKSLRDVAILVIAITCLASFLFFFMLP